MDTQSDAAARLAAIVFDESVSEEDRKWAKERHERLFGPVPARTSPPGKSAERIKAAQEAGQIAPPSTWDKIKAGAEGAATGLRAVENGLADTLTFGLLPKATDALGLTDKAERERHAQEVEDLATFGHDKRLANAAALGRGAGSVALSGAVGPARALGAGATRLMGAVERSVPAAALSPAARAFTNATATGGLTGGAYEGLDATLRGEDWDTIVERARAGAGGGALIGGGLATAANVARPAVSSVTRALGQTDGGKARDLLEGAGVPVPVFTRPRPLGGMEPNDVNIGRVARDRSAQVLNDMEGQYFTNVVGPHSAARNAIAASPAGQGLRDVTQVLDELAALETSASLLPGEADAVRRIREQYQAMALQNMGQNFNQPLTTPHLTETQLNDMRQALGRASKVGSTGPASVPEAELDRVRRSAKQLVDQGPFANTNRRFAEGTTAYEEQRGLLGLEAKPQGRVTPEGPTAADLEKMSLLLTRAGQQTSTAGRSGAVAYAEQFIRQNPQYAALLKDPRLLEAAGELQFGLPMQGGIIPRLQPLGILTQNANALTGRVLYPAAQAADRFVGLPYLPGFIPEIEQNAALAQQRLAGLRERRRE